MTEASVLSVEGLTSGYNYVPYVREVSFSLAPGELVALLGPNGAGKTTLLLSICGCLKRMAGEVRVNGRALPSGSIREAARAGIGVVPDDRGLFQSLTVEEHLRLTRKRGMSRSSNYDSVLDSFPQLRPLMKRRCRLLSGGEQQMLAIAKTLLLQPRVLLIDELSLGLAPLLVKEVLPAIYRIGQESSMAILLVEQHAGLALRYSDRAIVMNHGQVVLQEASETLLANRDELAAAYFA